MDYIVDPLAGRPETDVVHALARLRTAQAHMLRRRQSMQGLGESDGAALRLVVDRVDDDPVTPTDIATHLGLTTSAVTSLVDRLGKAGLIETMPHPTDRRRKIIVPTEGALAVDPLEAHIQDLVEELSTRSRLLVVGFLDRVVAAVEDEAR